MKEISLTICVFRVMKGIAAFFVPSQLSNQTVKNIPKRSEVSVSKKFQKTQ